MFQSPELLLHEEMRELLFTDRDCTPLFVPFIHRKIRRSVEDNSKIPCLSCNVVFSGVREGQVDCPYCDGVGYLWDESVQEGFFYKQAFLKGKKNTGSPSPIGKAEVSLGAIVTHKSLFLEIEDGVASLLLRQDKRIAIPFRKLFKYSVYFSNRLSSNQTDSEFNIAGLSE